MSDINEVMLWVIVVLSATSAVGITGIFIKFCCCQRDNCNDDLDKVNALDVTYNDIYRRMESNA